MAASEAWDQWRVSCPECGDPDVDRRRMHTEVGSDGDRTIVECNSCGNRRTVGG